MTMRARLFALLAMAALPLAAAEAPQWPPSEEVQQRMHELQQVMIARDSTPAQRDAAREELANLLKSPAGRAKPTPDEKPPPRAAIEPYGPILMPAIPAAPRPAPASSDVARLEVTQPPRPILIPIPGAAGRVAIDPATGNLLRETPAGYVDPRTGQVHPR
jgi:hypothetical protein